MLRLTPLLILTFTPNDNSNKVLNADTNCSINTGFNGSPNNIPEANADSNTNLHSSPKVSA